MEVKPHSQKKAVGTDKSTERLPSIPLNLCHVISDQNVAKITVEGLKLLTSGRINSLYEEIKAYSQDDVPKSLSVIKSRHLKQGPSG
jgi:hypothetical protein